MRCSAAVWQAEQRSKAWFDNSGSGTPSIARLRPGVTLAQARAAFDALTAPTQTGPSTFAPAHVAIGSLYDEETSDFGATIKTLTLAVGIGRHYHRPQCQETLTHL